MINVAKMREARELLNQVDALMFESGAYDHTDSLSSCHGLRDLTWDLDADIARVESGDVT